MNEVETCEVLINGKWPLVLPRHRAERAEWQSGWEPERLDSMYANLRPGMVVYDVGTEEGDLSALFAMWTRGCSDPLCPCRDGDACHYEDAIMPDGVISLGHREPDGWHRGGVVLIEPNPLVWPNIRCIWEANRLPAPLWCLEGFAAEIDANLGIAAREIGDPWPASAYGPVIGDHGFRNVMEHPEQPCVTVDTIWQRFAPPPDAITMDVEGAEILVARGMQETLMTHRPLVWVSVHAEAMFHDHAVYQAEFHSQLHQCGYEKVLLGFDHELHAYFYPSERRDEVALPCLHCGSHHPLRFAHRDGGEGGLDAALSDAEPTP